MALAGAPQSRYTIVPACEVIVSETLRQQLAHVTALLAARARKCSLDSDTIPTGEWDNLAIKPEYRERPVQLRELAAGELRKDAPGLADGMPDALRKDAS